MSDRENFIVYDLATGLECWRSQGNTGDAAIQQLPDGLAAAVVPMVAVAVVPTDLELVKAYYRAIVDMEAGRFRMQYITDVPGQAQTYERKEVEARAWQEGDDLATYPFMAAEASLRGVDISVVRDDIMAQVNALIPLAAKIEARRLVTKQAITDAETIGAIVAASQVNWQAALL